MSKTKLSDPMTLPADTRAATTGRVEQFEASLSELETLIGKMEQGDLSLDDTVKGFERGMALYDTCKSALDQASLKVELLLKGAAEIGAKTRFDSQMP
jgi:exodeoxyribonuclease VII small subunit